MISILVVIAIGWLLAAKVRPVWAGVVGCVVAGVAVGVLSEVIAEYAYAGSLPVDPSRSLDAALETSVRLAVIAIVFYAIERYAIRRIARLQAVANTPSDTRKCPYCAEVIKAEAIVCKHCGRDLSPSAPAVPDTAAPTSAMPDRHRDGAGDGALTPEASMQLFGITFVNDQYVFQEYRYEKLNDAINYAKLVAKRKQF